MSPFHRRRSTSSPDHHSRRHRSRSRSPNRHSSRHKNSNTRNKSPCHSPLRSKPPILFPSHHTHPNLPAKLRVLCEIISSPSTPSSHSLPSLLDGTNIRVTQSDVEGVLRLSYSHPGPALTFFRWAGEWCLNHTHSPYSWNLVVDMLGKTKHFDAMWDTVRSMRDLSLLSLATFASIFSSLAEDRRAGEAFAAFRALPMYGVSKDTVALNSLLAALCRAGLVVDGCAVLHESVVESGVKPDVDSFAVLLEGCENKRDGKRARKVFDEMIAVMGWNPINRPAYDSFLVTVLSSDDDDGGLIEAMRFLEELRRHDCSPGPKFFLAALQVCNSKSDYRSAVALWNDYVKSGVCPPDIVMYNYIISISCKEKQSEAAMRYFDEMVLHGAFPDQDTYNALFEMLVKTRKVREAVAVLNEMLKNECLPTHTNCLLAFDTKDPDLCIKVWQCMLKHGIHPLEEAGNSLISLLNKLELLPEACKYAEDLIDNGVKLSSYNLADLKRSLKKVKKENIHDNLLLKRKQRCK